MTRITNIGRKRSYVEASFNYNEEELPQEEPVSTVQESAPAEDEKPPKKKRKRGKKTKETAVQPNSEVQGISSDTLTKPKNSGSNSFKDRKLAAEQRRLKRIADRDADKTCFACREIGHAVYDCPKIADGSIKAPEKGVYGKQDGTVVGICYRCGSRRHRLSQCKERVADTSNPLPFASCFVCSGTGHLASSCPDNKAKGVYPNGGCCKICQQTDHLARDCQLLKKEVAASTTFVGMGGTAGADEDDFHALKRTTGEVERGQKQAERTMKMVAVKVGVHSGKPSAFSNTVVGPKKVINF